MIDLGWQSAHEPKENHVDGHSRRSEDSARNACSPHRRDPRLVGNDDVRIYPTSEDARVAVAVVQKLGELETGYHEQPRRIEEREYEADPTEGDGDESGEAFDG